jgi:cyclopropane fatty-acyl-phospholipid synthase-like methyltransferase
MTTAHGAAAGSASRWGPLWGARPAEWALSEDQQVATYEAALDRVGVVPGTPVLDIACGAGSFLQLVVERGGEPHGIDASEALIAFTRSLYRTPTYASAKWRTCLGRTTASSS